MKLIKLGVCAILAVIPLSACTNSNQSLRPDVISQDPPSSEKAVNLEARDDIKKAVLGYVDFNCTPKYVTDLTDYGDGVKLSIKNMKVFNDQIGYISTLSPEFMWELDLFLDSEISDSTYGNLVIRTTYLASAYHSALSGLYSYIYDIQKSQLRPLRKDYSRFRSIADRTAKKLCPLAKQSLELIDLDASTQNQVSSIYEELATNWPAFKSWWISANNLQENVSRDTEQEIQDFMTPKCTEYPTSDGKYVVVKCTVPPG